jgi:hypothetical protein
MAGGRVDDPVGRVADVLFAAEPESLARHDYDPDRRAPWLEPFMGDPEWRSQMWSSIVAFHGRYPRELEHLKDGWWHDTAVETLSALVVRRNWIGQTAGAERFKSDAHFARLAGVAQVPVSSSRHDRHRLDRGGNRQINRALHVIAITRGRLDPETGAYLQRKEAEGMRRMEACAA